MPGTRKELAILLCAPGAESRFGVSACLLSFSCSAALCRYGPETVNAMPKADDKVKEDLFDESADQRTDGIPGSGFHHFGGRGSAGAGIRAL